MAENDHDDKVFTQFCAPMFQDIKTAMTRLDTDVRDEISKMDDRLRAVEIVTMNGFDSRVKMVERMQWWLLGAIGGIGGLMVTLHLIG